jgi:multiple sugar transport system substrate-binding protein
MQPKCIKSVQLFLLFYLGLSFGCGGTSTEKVESSKDHLKGTAIRMACPDALSQTLVSSFGRNWAARQGMVLETVSYAEGEGGELSGNADIVICNPAQMPMWLAKRGLLPIPSDLLKGTTFNWSDFLPIYRDKLLVWDQTSYGFPLLGEAPLCFFRKDLLEDPENRKKYKDKFNTELVAPATWEQYRQICDFFASNVQGRAVLPPLSEKDDELEWEFYTISASFVRKALVEQTSKEQAKAEVFSFHFDISTGKPRIAGAGFVHALKFLQSLQPYRDKAKEITPLESFGRGKAMLCLGKASWVASFQKESAAKDRFAVTQIPGSDFYFDYDSGDKQQAPRANRIPYLGANGYLAAVLKDSKIPDAAFSFLSELSNRDTSSQIVMDPQWGGGVTRQDQLRNPTSWYGFGLSRDQTIQLLNTVRTTVTHAEVKNPVLRLRTPNERAYRQILAKHLRAALKDNADALLALQKVAEEWESLNKKLGQNEARRDYLLSLGLQP